MFIAHELKPTVGAMLVHTKEKEGRAFGLRGMAWRKCAYSVKEQRPESSKVADITSYKVRGVLKQKRLLGLGTYFAMGCGVRDVWNNCKQELPCPY